MTGRSESRPSDAALGVAVFASIALFLGAWTLLHVGFYTHKQIIDTPVYQYYGNAMAKGSVPYRDFDVEYPPGALPAFALPGLAEPGHDQQVSTGFRRTFESLMWVCGAAALVGMGVVLRRLRVATALAWGALTFAALAPLALGSVILSRFDLWPTALVVAGLAALVSDRFRLGHGLLALGAVVKIFPAVLLPLAVTYAWRRAGRREAGVCCGVVVALAAAVVVPFAVLAPGGVWHSITVQLRRPLQVESLGSAFLLAAHHLFGVGVTAATSHGSQNLAGGAPDAVAAISTALQLAVLGWIWWSFARGNGSREELVRWSAAAVCAFVAFGKVLSPQFLIWLIPLVPLVRGKRGLLASALLLAALVLTQVWFPFRYFRFALHFEPGLSWVVLSRDLVLVSLVAVLLVPLRIRRPARALSHSA